MSAGYSEHDWQRLLAEPAKRSGLSGPIADDRTPFSRDRARVLHSAALRRLAGKTQVVGPAEGDVPRTRLTHSLEVAQIGRGIAEDLGADADLVDTAGMAHDIGHPPFGHNGETALDEAAGRCGGFEGNAQTLRILTRLEPKVITADGASYGLNLTRAGLDAACKYPWPRRAGIRKFGVYADDLPVFEWMRAGAPTDRRCIEAQIMDWSDDVAYSVHDVEDGVLSHRISLAVLADAQERAVVAELAAKHFSAEPLSALEEAAATLCRLPAVTPLIERDYQGSFADQVALKRLTSELVGRFASAAVTETRLAHGPGPLVRYRADLRVPHQVAAEVALLKALALRYVMSDPHRLAMQRRQRELLAELLDALGRRAPEALDPALRPAWAEAEDDCARWRVVLDQVVSLTDAQALRWHDRLLH
ncbi:MAG TPA: deoxyguanosinetriphosphate triphosphohydrolase [Pseudonocardiaceae bacterium]|nr:deoxyguanosinetriphosphate triphosphohydrolase [Pseudonocardiaceae bacterium]